MVKEAYLRRFASRALGSRRVALGSPGAHHGDDAR